MSHSSPVLSKKQAEQTTLLFFLLCLGLKLGLNPNESTLVDGILRENI